MIPNDEEMQILVQQLTEWRIELVVLAEKQQSAELEAKKLAQELDELRVRHRVATQQLRKRESHKTDLYMWENIGDGG